MTVSPKLAREIGEAAYKADIPKHKAAELAYQLAKSMGYSSKKTLPQSETISAYDRIQHKNEKESYDG